MHTMIEKGIDWLTDSVNLSTGLGHPNDERKARALFRKLHERGVPLRKPTIVRAARARNWPWHSAEELGRLGHEIGAGGVLVGDEIVVWGPPARIVEAWSNRTQ
jgi:hypothetical protein